jgi:DNA-binding MarR family transcriptional regulator
VPPDDGPPRAAAADDAADDAAADAAAADAACVMDGLRRLVRALRTAAQAAQRERGVSGAQLYVLRQLAVGPPLSLREVAERTLTAQSSVSEVVARLVERGLVRSDPDARDRRRRALTLTDAGRAALGTAPETVQEQLVRALRALPAARRRELARGMDAWLAAAGVDEVEPTMLFEDGEMPGPRPT